MSKLENKLDTHIRKQYKIKRRNKIMMILLIVGSILVVTGGSFVIAALLINEKNNKEIEENIFEKSEIIEADLSDVGPADEEPIKEWAEMNKQEKYKKDISESIPDLELEFEEAEMECIIEEGNGEDFDGYLDIPLSHELQVEVFADCDIYGVPYALAFALMDTESSFRSDIGNEEVLGGEEGGPRYYGYMQLSIDNCLKAEEYGLNAHTPEGNIEMGIKILGNLLLDYDEEWEAITAYKGGAGYLESCKAKGIIPQTTQNVLEKKSKYEAMIKGE